MSYITPNGKELQITIAPNTSHHKISFTSGGELPVELSGLFTSTYEATKAILAYLGKKESGTIKKNAKNTTD